MISPSLVAPIPFGCVTSDQASGNHVKWVGGVGATGDGTIITAPSGILPLLIC